MKFIRKLVRKLGFDIVRYPHAGSLGHHLLRVLSHLDINYVLDVGAHRGEYAKFLRDLGFTGHIESIEPVPDCFEELERNMAGDPRWRGHELALGNHSGAMPIQVRHGSDFSSFRTPSAYGRRRFEQAMDPCRTVTVEVRRLDHVFEALVDERPTPRVLLKLDTQGTEMEVLEGAGARLDRIAALQLEVAANQPIYEGAPSMWEILPRLARHDFVVSGLFPVSLDRESLGVVEFDAVAVRTTQFV